MLVNSGFPEEYAVPAPVETSVV